MNKNRRSGTLGRTKVGEDKKIVHGSMIKKNKKEKGSGTQELVE